MWQMQHRSQAAVRWAQQSGLIGVRGAGLHRVPKWGLNGVPKKNGCRFKAAKYSIAALSPKQEANSREALSEVQRLEGKLLEKQSTIRVFQNEYQKVCCHWSSCSPIRKRCSTDVLMA